MPAPAPATDGPQGPETAAWPRRMGRVLLASLKGWIRHRCPSKGAALAYYTLFSVAPILVLALAIAGRLLRGQATRGELSSQLKDLVGPQLASVVQSLVLGVQVHGSGRLATVLAAILIVIGATSVFAELKDNLDEIWQQQAPIPAGLLALLRTRLLAFVLVLVLTCLLLASLAVNVGLALMEASWTGVLPAVSVLSPLVAFAITASLFVVICRMLPEAAIAWRDATVGALFTASLFTLGKRLIGVYLGKTALASSFGAAGSVAAMLIWVYYSAQIFLLGAEFTREFGLAFGRGRTCGPAPGPFRGQANRKGPLNGSGAAGRRA